MSYLEVKVAEQVRWYIIEVFDMYGGSAVSESCPYPILQF